ncbi:MAG: recombinase zinc beta ribbon domain-containing protein [Chloroflexi bacterium]|nr:recombinase zinc beta ribbon domain-containing protein [Chloroflexota bacterium]
MPKEKPLKIILWVAVSSLEQAAGDKESLPRQEADILNDPLFAKADVVDTIRIPGHSRAYTNFDRFVAGCIKEGINAPARMYDHFDKQDFDVLVVRDGSRLGREWGIFGELVQLVINAGARIYVQNGFGWVDSTNIDAFIMTNAYAATKQIKDLVRYREMGMSANVKRGLKMGTKPPRFFIEVRDPQTGKPLGIKPDRGQYQRLFDDFFTAYVHERIPYDRLGDYLYSKFGHVDPLTNKPYTKYVFYGMLFSAPTWGHTVYGRRRKQNRNGSDVKWAYWITGDEPPPEQVKFFHDTVEPIWLSPEREQVKGELKHRHYIMKGRMGSRTQYLFSGLLICPLCGSSFSGAHYHRPAKTYMYYRCTGRHGRDSNHCPNLKQAPEDGIVQWLTPYIARWREEPQSLPVVLYDTTARHHERLAAIDREIAEAEGDIARLSVNLGKLGENTDRVFRREIKAHNDRIDILNAQRISLLSENLAAEHAQIDRNETIAHLQKTTMTEFWSQPPYVINQWLHRLLGRTRIAILDREPVDFVAPVDTT